MSSPQNWQQLITVLSDVIANRIGLIEGCRRITTLRYDVGEPDNELFFPFLAVDSETDHFPLGAARNAWSPVALQREDEKRVRYEREARSELMEAANELLQYAWTKTGQGR